MRATIRAMKVDRDKLPNDPDELKRIIEGLQARQQEMADKVEQLQEEICRLRKELFGPKSEKRLEIDSDQGWLFDLAEADESEPEPDGSVSGTDDEDLIEVSYKRRKGGRKPLSADLPRVDIVHDIPDGEKHCACGEELVCIGEEVSERLRYVPAQTTVERHIRKKYACRCCEGTEDYGPTVKLAALPPRLLPKTIATPSLLAHILTSKYCDALPFYRQEKQFKRIGVEISRTTMCNWAIKVASALEGLIEALERSIRSGPLIGADETIVQVLKELDRAATTKSYMWVFRGGDPSKPGIRFRYAPTRAGAIADAFLAGYTGVVQTDGYKGYDFLGKLPGLIHLACWAHVRRKFVEVTTANRKANGDKQKKRVNRSEKIVKLIGRLYHAEKQLRTQDLAPDKFVAERRTQVQPVLDELKSQMEELQLKTPPGGLLGKAVSYALKQWDRLTGYVDHAFATPDNNLVENAIRPFVVGRKNWLFSGHAKGAEASAALYSLIETAKANGLESFKYLEYVFERAPYATTKAGYEALLPQSLTMKTILEAAPVGPNV